MPNNTYEKRDPATGQWQAHVPCMDALEVDAAVIMAAKVGETLRQTPLKQRVKALGYTVKRLQQEATRLAKLVMNEVGKPELEALQADVLGAAGSIAWIAQNAEKILKPRSANSLMNLMLGRTLTIEQWPLCTGGVLGVITPWNYPLNTPAGTLAAGLVAGNGVVFKPSELTTESGRALFLLFQEGLAYAGLPVEALQMITGAGETGKHLVAHPKVRHICFTGSTQAGRWIQNQAGVLGKTCTLELGGSDAAILLPSCKPYLDTALSYALWGRFSNAGQTCAAVKRLWVHSSLYDEAVAGLKTKLELLRVGLPSDEATHMGPLISEGQLALYQAQLEEAQADGGLVYLGKQALPQAGYFTLPCLVENVPESSRFYQEEVFGPALLLHRFEEASEVSVALNALPYGLGVSVFGEKASGKALADTLQTGHVGLNDLAMLHYAFPQVPWSGWKASGSGCRQGVEGLLALSQPRVVSQPLLGFPVKAPFLFSFVPDSLALMRYVLPVLFNVTVCLKAIACFPLWLWQKRPASRL
jgi:acyl-CoA reductase-like NAD-dependent aldehyde dehydrogenase